MAKKRVLLIENSQTYADILLEFLDKEGYETVLSKNGFEGIKKVFDFLPELIITDINIPVFSGYQVVRFLKSRSLTSEIPFVVFSLQEESSEKFRSELAGVDIYIGKSQENFEELSNQVKRLLDKKRNIDYELIEREGKKLTDDSLVEAVNNLLENKLFQKTLVGMLAELSVKQDSLDETVKDIFTFLTNSCNAEISSIMIKDADDCLLVYNANNAGYTAEIADDFKAITIADFNQRYSDYKVVSNEVKDIFPAGENNKKIESYILIPLLYKENEFATVHIGTSIKEYFSPVILENINIFLSAAAPVIANALRLRQMENLQTKTRTAFARYVPADVMDEIIKKSAAPVSQSENRTVAVLFSDIRSFTKISENTPARELVNFLNIYFSAMGNQIILEGGNIDKFIGDAIMAIFGAPKTLENAASSAIRAAINMVKALELLDTSDIVLPDTGFGTGIGINYGECVVGNIGFQNKLDFTVIGDTVNLASRAEGVTKYYQLPIIVTEYVYATAKDDFIFRKADSVRVKGKDHPVGLYAVYEAFQDKADDKLPKSLVIDRETLDQYNKGLKLFSMREWETAKQYFKKAISIAEKADKDDYLSSMYLSRIEEYQINPPPPDWDGTINMTEK